MPANNIRQYMKRVCKMFTQYQIAVVRSVIRRYKPSDKTLQKIERDYEPEQAWGSADDYRKHLQYGGTREDY